MVVQAELAVIYYEMGTDYFLFHFVSLHIIMYRLSIPYTMTKKIKKCAERLTAKNEAITIYIKLIVITGPSQT